MEAYKEDLLRHFTKQSMSRPSCVRGPGYTSWVSQLSPSGTDTHRRPRDQLLSTLLGICTEGLLASEIQHRKHSINLHFVEA